MSRIKVKNLPKLKLTDLLRRRKTTLERHLKEFGIITYESLIDKCNRMGVDPPTLDEFLKTNPNPPIINSPAEGVVVLEAPPVIHEITGKKIEDIPQENENDYLENPSSEGSKKKSKKRKDNQGDINE